MIRTTTFFLLALLAGQLFAQSNLPAACGTHLPETFMPGRFSRSNCPMASPCDDFLRRDAAAWQVGEPIRYIFLNWIVLEPVTRKLPDDRLLALRVSQLNDAFQDVGIQFINYDLQRIRAVEATSGANFNTLSPYSDQRQETLNIFLVQSIEGGWGGFGYFPFQGPSLGAVILGDGLDFNQYLLVHEVGHVLGLYHTFAGTQETSSCSGCYEPATEFDGRSALGDETGDWCSDTYPADDRNSCATINEAPNAACDSAGWSNQSLFNYMSYSRCANQISPQQGARMRCMVETHLGSWANYAEEEIAREQVKFTVSDTFVLKGTKLNFTDWSLLPADQIESWFWEFDVEQDGRVSRETSDQKIPPSVTYEQPGSYSVRLSIVMKDGRRFALLKEDYVVVTAFNLNRDEWAFVYPSLVSSGEEMTILTFTTMNRLTYLFEIIDVSGRRISISQQAIQTDRGADQFRFRLPELAPGIYFIQIRDSEKRKRLTKIMVQ